MHPYISQSIAAEHVRDLQARASLTSRARQARHAAEMSPAPPQPTKPRHRRAIKLAGLHPMPHPRP